MILAFSSERESKTYIKSISFSVLPHVWEVLWFMCWGKTCIPQLACGGQRMISGVGPHLPPYLRYGLLLFTTGYTRLAIHERFASLHLSSSQRITELQILVLPYSDEVGSGDPVSGLTLLLQAFLSYLPRLWISFSVQQVHSMIQRTFWPIIYSLD